MSDGKQRICLIETVTADTSSAASPPATPLTRYQLASHLGSAVVELDGNAAVLSYEEYYPYGSTSFQTGPTGAEVGLKRYRYTGKERDGENGFYYHGARYYAPWLGRWMSSDPGGAIDGFNLYRYARDNPLRHSDPTGLQSTDNSKMLIPQAGPKQPAASSSDAATDSSTDKTKVNAPQQPPPNSSTTTPASPQMSLPLLGLTNPAFQGTFPLLTLRTEFLTVMQLQQGTEKGQAASASLSQTVSVTERISDTVELGVQGTAGTTTSSVGFLLHVGPPAPIGDKPVSAWGLWASGSQVWGLAPPPKLSLSPPPEGQSFNPTANVFGAFSHQTPNVSGVDLDFGGQASRWGQVVGVPVAGSVSPFVGINLFHNDWPQSNFSLNLEAVGSVNLGLGGRQDTTTPGSLPYSFSVTGGIGIQYVFDKTDWAIGGEIYFGSEGLSNIVNDAGRNYDLAGGLRFGFGAINPRRQAGVIGWP